jgi:hypothetical protein
VGSSGVVAAFAGTQKPISAAQPAPARIQIFTVENLFDQSFDGENATGGFLFKISIDKVVSIVPELNSRSG